MKIAIIQFAPYIGNLEATIGKLKMLLAEAKTANLVVLPELANSGYNFESIEQANECSEEVDNSIFLSFLKGECKKYKFAVATGFAEKDGEELFNSSVLLDEKGILGVYRKLHLFMNEKKYFQPGNLGLPVFEWKGIKIGMLVCFDWMFPETWRMLALKRVDVILHPSNLVLPYAQSVIPSYALVNRIFIATANRIGTERDLSFTGQSIIANTKGEVLVRGDQSEQVLMAEIEAQQARDKNITPLNNAFEDRRTDIY
jgi:predicted amidohydrolase